MGKATKINNLPHSRTRGLRRSGWPVLTLRRKSGFSLIELVVVVVVILILTLVAVGGYSNLRRSRSIQTGAQNIHAALSAARGYAVTTNGWYRVVFQLRNPNSGAPEESFWIDEIFPLTNGDPSPPVPEAAKSPKLTTPQRLPDDVDIADIYVRQTLDPSGGETTATAASESFAVIRFFPDGRSDEAQIRLFEEGSNTPETPRTYTVKLSPATAKPRILAADRR